MKLIPFLSLTVLVASGCRLSAPGYTPVPSAKVEPLKGKVRSIEEIMPLDVGNQWSYSIQSQSTKGKTELENLEGTLSYRVAQQDGTKALIVIEQEGKLLEQQDWDLSDRGLFQLSGTRNRVAFSSPQPLAQLPLDPGRTFSWRGRGPLPDSTVGEARMTATVRSPENVDTAIGSLQAIPIASHFVFDSGTTDNVSWYRPGIGLVRVRQITTNKATGRQDLLLLTLTTYTIKGVKSKL